MSPIENSRRTPSQLLLGGGLLTAGIIGTAFTYSLRPPSGAGDALQMLLSGRQNYIQPGPYKFFMAVTIGLALAGLFIMVRTPAKSKDDGIEATTA